MCSNGGRHLFTPEARDRGYPAEDPTHSFGSFDELRSAGFLVNDTLRLSASVRSTCHLLKRRLAASKAAVSLTWPRPIRPLVVRCVSIPGSSSALSNGLRTPC